MSEMQMRATLISRFELWSAKTWLACLVALLATFEIHGLGQAQTVKPEAATEKFEIFKFEEVQRPDPNQIVPRKWNWEIRLSPSQSQRGFRISQHTVAEKASGSNIDKVLFDAKDLQKNPGDVIHFRLHTGDDNPSLDMNKKGNIGLGVSFARVGGGYGASGWIVMPGRIVRSQIIKQDYLKNGGLPLVSIETVDALGSEYRTELRLEENK